MTKPKPQSANEKPQGERFKEAAQRLIDAGELNPTEAERIIDSIIRSASRAEKL